jgi:carbamate kinase
VGRGAPVVRNRLGELDGIEAVVDKDFATGLLAEALDADMLGPKVEAVCRFVELTGGTAAIGSLRDAILAGKAGTVVTPSGTYLRP